MAPPPQRTAKYHDPTQHCHLKKKSDLRQCLMRAFVFTLLCRFHTMEHLSFCGRRSVPSKMRLVQCIENRHAALYGAFYPSGINGCSLPLTAHRSELPFGTWRTTRVFSPRSERQRFGDHFPRVYPSTCGALSLFVSSKISDLFRMTLVVLFQ